jgi:hypothetical protein
MGLDVEQYRRVVSSTLKLRPPSDTTEMPFMKGW